MARKQNCWNKNWPLCWAHWVPFCSWLGAIFSSIVQKILVKLDQICDFIGLVTDASLQTNELMWFNRSCYWYLTRPGNDTTLTWLENILDATDSTLIRTVRDSTNMTRAYHWCQLVWCEPKTSHKLTWISFLTISLFSKIRGWFHWGLAW